jgi:hypothetical protein
MKSPMLKNIKVDDPENYSDLKVMHSAAGYYIGTTYTDPKDGFAEPGSRDSQYFKEKETAEDFLKLVESHDPDAIAELKMYP